jgi:glycosyltransferase involved in cell wall biosynthesis
MRVLALMTVRNEELVLERALAHLETQGVEVCLIDNGSSDRTVDIARAFRDRCVVRLEHLAFQGRFELARVLQNEERLAREIEADWYLHHDADEIREAPVGMGTLAEAFARVAAEGYNAIDFDEFVFVPTSLDQRFEGRDFVAEMSDYYYFCPAPLRRVNAWRRRRWGKVDLTTSGGHSVRFRRRTVYPQPFILRHYMALSMEYARRKFGERRFDPTEVAERGWHLARASFDSAEMRFPPASALRRVDPAGAWDRSAPLSTHPLFGEAG